MDITIIFQTILDYNLDDKICVQHVKRTFAKQHTDAYQFLLDNTHLTKSSSFPELKYCASHNITTLRTCSECNEQHGKWNYCSNTYRIYCSRACAKIGNVTAMKLTMKAKYGVSNASSLPHIKEKKRQSALEKYGVDNVSKAQEIKDIIGSKCTDRWKDIYNEKDFTTDNLTREQYRHRVQQYADTQYLKYKHILDPDNKRSKEWHLDHIYSVHDGFNNDVPVNVLSDVSNLKLLSANENYQKHRTSNKTLEQLYEDYLPASSS